MRRTRWMLAVVGLALLGGCYHATVDTGLPHSSTVIVNSFASSWIYGLVPPKTLETAALCPEGVAKVETKLSFLNQLVGLLTLGIYTPMQITVTCAESSASLERQADLLVSDASDGSDVRSILIEAADLAVAEKRAVYVRF